MTKKSVDDLRRDRKAAAVQMEAVAAKIAELEATEGGADAAALTAASAEFDAAKGQFEALNAAVQRAEAVEAAKATAAAGDQGKPAAGVTVYAQAADPAMKGVDLGLTVIALAQSKGDRDKAVTLLEREGHSGLAATLNTGTESAGGVLVPRPMAETMIELLRARVVVRNAGARVVPMPAGQLRHARQNGAATAGYSAENAAITPSEPTTDKIDQTFKKLTGLVPVSNSLLRFTTQTALLVRDDLLAVMARREDLAFIRGDGSANTPTGIRSWTPGGNIQTAVANTFAAVDVALRTLVSRVADGDVPMVRPGWIMRAGTREFLGSLRDALGNLAYPSINATGTLFGYPIYTTSQIPNNLGAGTNQTEVYFADFNEVMIGDASALTLSVSTEAAYVQGGNWRSAFQNDETLMRAISEHDLAPAHTQGLAYLTGVNWSL
ncbi:phage major capsid protein [Paragemmobacter ruber]|uniref:Phage major capsid protein n=1 Tax=Paragemmobacter ruber TaxID=1985673 RepID=A0ABW9Y1C4_9RHOB|nr:phage major capsid protein [Rhodobacter ruber]NBE05936.1 phage major capsid protein [Rhodobacter ruber]